MTQKKTKMEKTKKGIAPIFVFLMLLGFGFATYLGGASFLNIGGSVLSLDSVQYSDSDKRWVATIVVDGSGENLYGTFPAEQLRDGDYSAQRGFNLGIRSENQVFSYPLQINDQSNPIYTYQILDSWSIISLLDGSKRKACEDNNFLVLRDSSTSAYCVKESTIGYMQNILNPAVDQKINVELQSGGKTIRRTVSYTEKNVDLGPDGEIRLLGGLWTGNSQPNMQNFVGINSVNSGIRITEKTNYENYVVSLGALSTSGGSLQNKINQINTLSTRMVAGSDLKDPFVEKQYESAGKYIVEVSNPVTVPFMRIILSANLVGVERSSGMPQIIGVSDISILSGQTGFVQVDVKNIGSKTGSFEVRTVCDSGVSAQNSQIVSLLPSESKIVTIPITGTQLQTQTQVSCAVTVVDVNDITKTDSDTFTVDLSPRTFCDSSSLFVVGNQVLRYNTQCTGTEVILDCGSLEPIYKNSQYQCPNIPAIPATVEAQIQQCRADGGSWIWTTNDGLFSSETTGYCKLSNFIWGAFFLFFIGLVGTVLLFFYAPIPPLMVISSIMLVIGFIWWILGIGGFL